LKPDSTVLHLQGCLDRLLSGEFAARDELLMHCRKRVLILAERMFSQSPRVGGKKELNEVVSGLLFFSIGKMLDSVETISLCDYLRLTAANIRDTLIDLIRQDATPHSGSAEVPDQTATHPNTNASSKALSLADWTAFHELAARLTDDERDVLDLLYYHNLTQEEAANVLGLSPGVLKRRWQSSRLTVMESLGRMPRF
jgi:RNA polymerase sigma factor (sigma-70 family)